MSSDPPNASPSPAADEPPADDRLLEQVRLRGAPLLEALEGHVPGAREHAEATGGYAFAGLAASWFESVLMPGVLPLLAAGGVLVSAAIVASLMPAARASRVDVLQALRSE